MRSRSRTAMYEPELVQKEPKTDWLMLASIGGLMLMGVAFIFSASTASDPNSRFWIKQVVAYALGIVLAFGICCIRYETISRFAIVGYWLSIVLLLSVMLFGTVRLGAKRWIQLGFFQFQPSEFAKLAFIFMQASFLSRPKDELRDGRLFIKALLMTALPFVLILKEPDLGSALVLFPIGLAMMFVAGVPTRFLLRFGAGIGILVALLLVDILFAPPNWQIKLEEYQRQRLLVYFGQDFAPRNATEAERQHARRIQKAKSYNVEQALISVGSGGLTGKGWRQGTQNSLGYLPRAVAHNDFIFSVIAEEKGFLGSVIVIGLYSVLIFSGIKIAAQARDRLGKLLAVGVVTLLFSHVFINIGMNIRLMPVTGIPLPLLSYGGTSVLCSLVAIGVLQNVYIYRRSY
jgi:rod shape determining protein RodA